MGGTNELTTFQTSKFTGKLPDKVLKAFQTEWDAEFENPVSCTAVALSDSNREEVRATLQASLAPCGRSVAAEMIYGLAVALPSQSREAEDRKARAMVYASTLQDYPLDVLQTACDRLLRSEEWFPPIARILRQIEPEVNRRKMMLAALDKPPVQNLTMLTKPSEGMMTWALLVVFSMIGYGGVSSESIGGYRSAESCNKAAMDIYAEHRQMNVSNWPRVFAVCVPAP